MANPTTPYGFKFIGLIEGADVNFGLYTGSIGASNTGSIYQGDPAVLSSGIFAAATATGGTGAPVAGHFVEFEWLSLSAGYRVRNRAWLGQTGDIAGGVVNCKVAMHPQAKFQARVTGASNNPITAANIGEFVNFTTGATPGPNLISTYSVDATTLASSSTTLPYKIYDIIQQPESDPTSADNEIVVIFSGNVVTP